MENIILQPLSDEVTDFIKMDESIYKNILYKKKFKLNSFTSENILKSDDGNLYYAQQELVLKRGVKYYLSVKKKIGFTLNPKGKLHLWFGSNIGIFPIKDILDALKIDWVSPKYFGFFTKTIFEKILSGKITNPPDLCKAILKNNRVKSSHKLLRKAIEQSELIKISFLLAIKTAKNFDHYLEFYILRKDSDISADLQNQAIILDRKIDFKWSEARMKDEHNKWTRELMEIEYDYLEDEEVSSLQAFREYPKEGFTLLDTLKKVFAEGTLMKHCLYVNYWQDIKHGHYLAYHVEKFGESATLGIHCYIDKLEFSQIYGIGNTNVSAELKHYAIEFIQELNDKIFEKETPVQFNVLADVDQNFF